MNSKNLNHKIDNNNLTTIPKINIFLILAESIDSKIYNTKLTDIDRKNLDEFITNFIKEDYKRNEYSKTVNIEYREKRILEKLGYKF